MKSLDHIWSRLGRRASQRLRTGDAPAAELPESTTTNVLHEEAPRPAQRSSSSVEDMPYLPGRMASTKPTTSAPNRNAFDPASFRPSAPPAPPAPPAPSARQRAAQVLPWLAAQVVQPWIPPPTNEDADPDLYDARGCSARPADPKAPASPAAPAPFQTAPEPPRAPWIPPPPRGARELRKPSPPSSGITDSKRRDAPRHKTRSTEEQAPWPPRTQRTPRTQRNGRRAHPYLTIFVGLPTVIWGAALLVSALRGTPLVQSTPAPGPSPDGGNDVWQSGDSVVRGNRRVVVIRSDGGAVKAEGRVATDAAPFVWTTGDKLLRKPGGIVILDRNGKPKAELAT